SDRTRDKKAALMRRGLYVGGTPPFGFTLSKGGRLLADPERAPLVEKCSTGFRPRPPINWQGSFASAAARPGNSPPNPVASGAAGQPIRAGFLPCSGTPFMPATSCIVESGSAPRSSRLL